ncbi:MULTISPECIES: DUF6894 family protein [unclassified Methylobacterium]|jgi:hypothetical protein|uniref:DUF6894 family protein n=1 Tax=unclassified Methylobacterium TaxID=2615210 RepID=UPI0006F63188|nr:MULTISPECIES: hypothetical protein [unclassified Methylobacterium]KQO49357.1 hypothetical protein ASF24_09415 [Methylobacterium sp. Leaf86]KQP00416.1 hypothetical protein ASF32_00545 [Methylobacterium sp. Leaf91]MBO1022399.1 hypothetical protein [Methylobacterium sp. SD274]
MPRFYLNIRDGDDLIEDQEGSVLVDVDAARLEALASARDILAELVRAGRLVDGQCFEIMDDSGELRAVVPFKEALKLD